MTNSFKQFSPKKILSENFQHPYQETMENMTDKPDLRNPLIIQDVTNIFDRRT